MAGLTIPENTQSCTETHVTHRLQFLLLLLLFQEHVPCLLPLKRSPPTVVVSLVIVHPRKCFSLSHTHQVQNSLSGEKSSSASLAVRISSAFPNRPRVQQISDIWPSVVCLCLGASVKRSVSVVALTMQAKSIVGHACADLQIRNPVRPRRWESSVWSAGSVALLGRPFYKVGRAGGRSQGLFAAWPVQQRSRPILPWAPNTNTFQKAR